MASVSKPTETKNYGPPLGAYMVGALVVVALADTRAAPVVVAFLAAAAIYNANYLLLKAKDPAKGKGGFLGGKGGAGSGGGGGGAW